MTDLPAPKLMRKEIERLKKRILELEQCESVRTQTEDALRTSQMRLSDAMELAHIVYWEFDPIVQTYLFNDPFYTFYGTTAAREGGYGMSVEEYAKRFIYPDDLPIYFGLAEQNIHRKDTDFFMDVKHRIFRRNGDLRHVLVRIRVIKDSSGTRTVQRKTSRNRNG